MPVNSFEETDKELKSILRCLLIARGKESVTIRNLVDDYREETDEDVPFKRLGYSTFLDYLRSIPDCVQITESNNSVFVRHVDSPNTKHISDLISRQRSPKANQIEGRKRYRANKYYPFGSCAKNRIPAELLASIMRKVHIDRKLSKSHILEYVNERVPELCITMEDLNLQLEEMRHQIILHDRYVISKFGRSNGHKPTKKEKNTSAPSSSSYRENNRSQNFKNNQDTKYSMPDDVCSDEYDDQYNRKCDKKENCGKNKDDENQVTNCSSSFEQYDPVNVISPELKSRLKKLIMKHPEGIWAVNLPDLYLKEFGKTLNYHDIGFSNVIELVYLLPTIFRCVQQSNSKKVLLFNAQQSSADLTNIQNQTSIFNNDGGISNTFDAVPLQQTPKVSERIIPLDVMGCEESVEQISVMELNITVRGYTEILVTEIMTPSFFWIQLLKNTEEFHKLMIDLNDFYIDVDENYKIPQAQLQVGLNVACMYDGLWHRAIIRNIALDGRINLMFYDYGTMRTYDMPELYFLDRAFSCLPAQAIPCGLYNVISCEPSKWPEKVIMQFANKVGAAPLIASVCSVDLQINSVMVSLTDTRGDDDVHISDWLIQNNLAKLGQVTYMPYNFPHKYYLSCMLKKDCDLLHRENNRSAPKVQVPIVEVPGLSKKQLDRLVKVVENRNHNKSRNNFTLNNSERESLREHAPSSIKKAQSNKFFNKEKEMPKSSMSNQILVNGHESKSNSCFVQRNVPSSKMIVSKPVLETFKKDTCQNRFSDEYEMTKDTQCQDNSNRNTSMLRQTHKNLSSKSSDLDSNNLSNCASSESSMKEVGKEDISSRSQRMNDLKKDHGSTSLLNDENCVANVRIAQKVDIASILRAARKSAYAENVCMK